MIVKLFDINNNMVVPTEHCYTLKSLKAIMDEYPDEYLKIYQYLFYMSCPNPDINPFFNMSELDKEEIVLQEIDADISTDDDHIVAALKFCRDMYETPTSRAFRGIKQMLDKLATYMENTEITHGRDGNINSLVAAAAKFQQIRDSYKGAYKDLQDEQKSQIRGGEGLAYDQQ